MKKLLVVAVALAAAVASAEMKFGTVDMLMLIRNHPKYDSDKQLLQDTEKDNQKKLDRIKTELEAIQEEGKKLADQYRNPMLAAAAKEKLEKELSDVQRRFVAGQQKMREEMSRLQQDLSDLEGRLLKATTDDLRKKIKEYAEKESYDFIFDQTAAPFVKEKYDVTKELLKAMGVDPAKAKAKGKNEGK